MSLINLCSYSLTDNVAENIDTLKPRGMCLFIDIFCSALSLHMAASCLSLHICMECK